MWDLYSHSLLQHRSLPFLLSLEVEVFATRSSPHVTFFVPQAEVFVPAALAPGLRPVPSPQASQTPAPGLRPTLNTQAEVFVLSPDHTSEVFVSTSLHRHSRLRSSSLNHKTEGIRSFYTHTHATKHSYSYTQVDSLFTLPFTHTQCSDSHLSTQTEGIRSFYTHTHNTKHSYPHSHAGVCLHFLWHSHTRKAPFPISCSRNRRNL